MDTISKECRDDMQKRVLGFEKDLGRVRTGRATVGLLDGIRVDYYGNPTPLNQVASLSTPDARQIVVAPFEKKMISEIERAIQMADIGIQPTNDGNVIRLPIPPLTEERRKEIAKSVKKLGEEAKVGIRKVRQDYNNKIRKMEKDKSIAEDQSKKLQKEIQLATDDNVKTIDQKVGQKEAEVLSM